MKNNILIIKHGALGDIILSGSAMQAIRKNHKYDCIICLTIDTYADILEACPWIDKVIVDIKPKWNDIKGWHRLKNIFLKYKFKKVYDLQTSYRSNIYFYLFFFLRKVLWSGIAYGSKYRHSNPKRKFMHTFERHKDQLKLCGIKYDKIPDWKWLSKNYENRNLLIDKDFAIIVPGSSPHRINKRWKKSSFAQLIQALSKLGIKSLLLGLKNEKRYIDSIIKMVDNKILLKPLNYAGKTNFKDIAYLSDKAKFAVGNDTGSMHLIASSGLMTIVLFGFDSDPNLCAPIGRRVKIIKEDNINSIQINDVMNILISVL